MTYLGYIYQLKFQLPFQQLMSTITSFRRVILILPAIVMLTARTLLAQAPVSANPVPSNAPSKNALSHSATSTNTTSNNYTTLKERLAAIRTSGGAMIKKQEYDRAIPVLLNGLAISRQAMQSSKLEFPDRGQTVLDSFTCSFYYQLGLAYRSKVNYDSALFYLAMAQKIADPMNLSVLRAAIHIEYYAIYNRLGKGDSATAAIHRLKDLLPRLDSNSAESGKIEMYLGHDEKHHSKYADALEHYYKALRIFSRQKDSVNEGNVYVSLANSLLYIGQKAKALEYHRQAADLFTLMGRRNELLTELLNITDLYYTSDSLDLAMAAIKKAIPIVEEMHDKNLQPYVYMSLGNIYKRRRNFKQAEFYFSRSITIGEGTGNTLSLMQAYQGLGEMYMFEKQPVKAQPYLEKHLDLARQAKSMEEVTEATWNLSENEYALHHYEKAYQYQKLYSTYRDSAYNKSSIGSMAEMETKYQAEKKEKEILLLKKDQQLAQLSLQKQKNIQIVAIVFFLLLVLIGFLVVNRYRIIHRAKRLLDMEKMRNSIARDLHDDIGSTLTSINILSKVSLQQHLNGETPMSINMQKIKDRSSAIMESMGDLVWTINPQNDTIEQMIYRMKEFTAEILEPLNINYTFKEGGDFSAIKLDIRKRKDFYLLFKEAINNAAKYSHCKNLVIELKQDQHCLRLNVSDDGTGFNEGEVRNGNGLRNMRGRAAAMQGGILIDAAKGRGTRIAVDVPIA
jgi:two-component system, NarL family, sensor histidine kinase UhpB